MTTIAAAHPATFSDRLLAVIAGQLPATGLVLDPMAGTGRCHGWATPVRRVIGVELEADWASMHPCNIVGDARQLPFADGSFDAIATSPPYGNRMADTWWGEKASKYERRTYAAALGRPLRHGSAAALQWGDAYRETMRSIWTEAARVLRPGGRFVLNVKDHVRRGERQPVARWHAETLVGLGLAPLRSIAVPQPGLKWRANAASAVDAEWVLVFDKGGGAEVGSEPYRSTPPTVK